MMKWVIKIGGSLFPEYAVKLCENLVGKNIIVICGGGAFANLLRDYDAGIGFSSTVTHRSAILCMDILGMLLADKVADAEAVYSLNLAQKALDEGKLPIFMPSKFLEHQNSLEHSWRVTSDSISLYIAHQLKAKLLIATDVDGIYTQQPSQDGAEFIKHIDAKKLLNFGETSVDEVLAELLIRYKLNCYVINGKHPERVISVIDANNVKLTKYTLIGGT
jgi:aspartokinase-like uncharacterized kinase